MAIDVCINVLFKPLQTALALFSLLRHSGRHIDRIYFHEENKNPPDMHAPLKRLLRDQLECTTLPQYINWHEPVDPSRLGDTAYRHSIRYQWGWERTDKDFLLLIHNDVQFHADIVPPMLAALTGTGEGGDEGAIAVGDIGNCGVCPAHHAAICTKETYWDVRPSHAYLMRLYDRMPPGKNVHPYNEDFPEAFRAAPWPLPHCRVNEWCMLIDMRAARAATAPLGPAMPLGAMASCGRHILDTGARWFRDVSLMGHRCRHFPLAGYMTHRFGHKAMLDEDRYQADELAALKALKKDFRNAWFGVTPTGPSA
ncbi:MAG: hypothetical protein AB7E47_08520 [Desulfovibrionaceae bacterium]